MWANAQRDGRPAEYCYETILLLLISRFLRQFLEKSNARENENKKIKCSPVAEMGDRLATIDMGQKLGELCPFGGELGPHLTQPNGHKTFK